MTKKLRIGFVGSGMIARIVADAVRQTRSVEVSAVASRRKESAAQFAKDNEIEIVFDSWRDLIASDAVDAVYVCTPTSIEEEICVAAAHAGKHVLADKPFASRESLVNIVNACKECGVLFMDATHFVHNPRTQLIKDAIANDIESSHVVRSAFFAPISDQSNIRFDPAKEPTGAFGDLGWYNMRAIVEYLPERGAIEKQSINVVHHPDTGAVVRAAGYVAFENAMSSTWDVGYDMGSMMMDLDIIGSGGAISVSDFVLDWAKGFAFNYRDCPLEYSVRQEPSSPEEWRRVLVPSEVPQAVLMVENFAELSVEPDSEKALAYGEASIATQRLLDSLWSAV